MLWVSCDAPMPLNRQLGGARTVRRPNARGTAGAGSGRDCWGGGGVGRGAPICVLFSVECLDVVVASGFGQSVRLVGRPLSVLVPDDHITRTALL